MENKEFYFTTGELARLTGLSKQLLIFYDKKNFFTATGYNSWRKNYGTSGVATVSASIPEPGAMALAAFALCSAVAKSGRRRSA